MAIDLSMVKMKLTLQNGNDSWSPERVHLVERYYRRFLYLTQVRGDRFVVPTKDIDAFWHQHILHTRAYAADCQMMFGHFLHHTPTNPHPSDDDTRRHQEAFAETSMLYEAIFGEEYSASQIGECEGGPAGPGGCGTGACKDE